MSSRSRARFASKLRRRTQFVARSLEALEPRRVLSGVSFPGNFAAPDLDLSAVPAQTVRAGETLNINLLSLGATVTDLGDDGQPTGDVIRYQLDPDVGTDTPVGAAITSAGVFTWTPTAGQVGTYNIIVIAIDGGTPHLADAETFQVTVGEPNVALVVDLNGAAAGNDFAATFTEDGGPTSIVGAADLTVTDGDDANLQSAQIQLVGALPSEALAVDTTGTSILANYNAATGLLGLTGGDTVAHYQQVLRTLTYNNSSQDPIGTRSVTLTVNDGLATSAVATATITLSAVNDLPVVDLNGNDAGIDFAATFTEDDLALPIAAAATVSDVDDTTLASATVAITGFSAADGEVLAADTTGTSIIAAYDAVTGILSLTGIASLEDYQQVLRTVTYLNPSQNPTAGVRRVSVVVNDGDDDSLLANAAITVVPVNDAPVVALATGGTFVTPVFTEGDSPVLLTPTGEVADADNAQLDSVTVTIVDVADTAAESLTVDLTGTPITSDYDPITGVLTLTGPATPAEFTQALQTLRYANSSQNPVPTSRQVSIVANDGTDSNVAATFEITVVPVNDAPNIDPIAPASVIVGQDLALIVSAADADDDLLTFSLDPDNSPASATLEIINNNTVKIHWTPTLADAPGPVQFRILVTDDDGNPLGDSETFLVTLIVPVAVVDLNGAGAGENSTATFSEGDADVALADAATIVDANVASLASATITLTNPAETASESLTVDTAGTAIVANYTAATGVLSLTGVDTVANYQAVLRTLRYANTSQDPGTVDRVVNVVVNNGFVDSAVVTATIAVTAVNDDPNLAPINDEVLNQYETLTFAVIADDADGPLDELTYVLDLDASGIPAAAAQPDITNPGGVFTWTPTVAGTFTIRVLVIDSLGGVDQEEFTVTVAPDQVAPTITAQLSNDTAAGGTTNSDTITSDPAVTGTVTDNGGPLTAFAAYMDGNDPASAVSVLGDLTGTQFSFDAARMAVINGAALVDGTHTLHLVATDSDGNASSVFDLPFTLDTTAPAANTPVLAAASDSGTSDSDGVTNLSNVTIQVAALAGETVKLFQDGVFFGEQLAAGPVEFVVTNLTDNDFVFTTEVSDEAGNTATSGALNITVDTFAPVITLLSPAANGEVSDGSLLAGNISSGLTILASLAYNFDALASVAVTFDGSGNFSQVLDLTGLADGEHVLHLVAIDSAGNTRNQDVTVTVNNAAAAMSAEFTPASVDLALLDGDLLDE